MKQLTTYLFIIIGLSACSSQEILTQNTNYSFPLKDISIMPDREYALPEFEKGDMISATIINGGREVVPYLIEQIKDSTTTQVRIADAFNYKVGDVAFLLIQHIYEFENPRVNNVPYADKILENQFHKSGLHTFELIFDLFHANSSEINQQNRDKLYRIMKKWYLVNPELH